MPQIDTQNPELTGLKGLHLWHAPLSSCSQRVRLVMAELGLRFESHLVNLEEGEHASEAYQAIHPKGVVPALVDDGNLFVESIDIIAYLAHANSDLASADADLLALADGAQLDLKLLTFEFLFRGGPPPDAAKAKAFQENHKNAWLKQFYLDFAAGFDPKRIEYAIGRTAAAFQVLEARLADGRAYLSGESFTLSDIAWLPNAHRFALMGWPYAETPNLAAWFERMKTRPSYQDALMKWQPQEVAQAFAEYTKQRQKSGTDVNAYAH